MLPNPDLRANLPAGPSPLARNILSLLEFPIALGVAFAVFVEAFIFGCNVYPCRDLATIVPAIWSVVAGIVAGIAWWIAAIAMGKRMQLRLTWDGIAAFVGIANLAVQWHR